MLATPIPIFPVDCGNIFERVFAGEPQRISKKNWRKAIKAAVENRQSSLDLSDCEINDQQLVTICENLFSRNDHCITVLSLAGNAISDRGVITIANFLKGNSRITCIDLSNNPMTNKSLDTLLEVLRTNIAIRQLLLFRTVRFEREAHLVPALTRNREICLEVEQFDMYVQVALLTAQQHFPDGVENILLEFVNSATTSEARTYVANCLYPPAKKIAKNITNGNLDKTKSTHEIAKLETDVPNKSLEERLKIIHSQYNALPQDDRQLCAFPFTLDNSLLFTMMQPSVTSSSRGLIPAPQTLDTSKPLNRSCTIL